MKEQHPHRTSHEQLSLLPGRELTTSPLPARFRISRDMRVNGLKHVAEIRSQLAAHRGNRAA